MLRVAFEGFGSIQSWLEAKGAAIGCSRLFEKISLPALEIPDLIIAMGGSMRVNDDEEHPGLVPEHEFIRAATAIDIPKPILYASLQQSTLSVIDSICSDRGGKQ
jgi:hypothetical protein